MNAAMGTLGLAIVVAGGVAIVVGIAALLHVSRPSAAKFAGYAGLELNANSATIADAQLRRTHRARRDAAFIGALSVVGTEFLLTRRLSIDIWTLAGAFAGGSLGIVFAQRRLARNESAQRSASLEVRERSDFEPKHAALIASVALVVLGASTAAFLWSATSHEPAARWWCVLPAFAVVAVIGCRRLERQIVLRGRNDALPTPVDNALRRTAVNALFWAAIGLCFCATAAMAGGVYETQRVRGISVNRDVVFEYPSNAVVIGTEGPAFVETPPGSRMFEPSSKPQPLVATWTDDRGKSYREVVEGVTTVTPGLWIGEQSYQPLFANVSMGVSYGATLLALIAWHLAGSSWKTSARQHRRAGGAAVGADVSA